MELSNNNISVSTLNTNFSTFFKCWVWKEAVCVVKHLPHTGSGSDGPLFFNCLWLIPSKALVIVDCLGQNQKQRGQKTATRGRHAH